MWLLGKSCDALTVGNDVAEASLWSCRYDAERVEGVSLVSGVVGCGCKRDAPGVGVAHRMVSGDHQHHRIIRAIDGCHRESDRRPRVAADRLGKDVIGSDLRRAFAHELHLARRHHDVGVVDGDKRCESLKGYREWAAPMQKRQERLRPVGAT